MAKKLKGYCYYCGAHATSLEHAPPRQMFKGFKCDSITVPSCDEHNTKKGGNDQAIVSAFLIPLLNSKELYPLEPEIELAVKQAIPSFERAKKKAFSAQLISNPEINIPNTSYLSHDAKLWDWMRQLTVALIYDATKASVGNVNWDHMPTWSPHWIQSTQNVPIELNKALDILQKKSDIKNDIEKLEWLDGWSSYPKSYPLIIYRFKIYLSGSDIIFCHTFYNRYDCYVSAHLPFEVLAKIALKAAKFKSNA